MSRGTITPVAMPLGETIEAGLTPRAAAESRIRVGFPRVNPAARLPLHFVYLLVLKTIQVNRFPALPLVGR
jgi:hypothetical protein